MSYNITLVKDAEGVRVTSSSGGEHIPDGVFVISGHVPAPGMSQIAALAISQSKPGGPYGSELVASCTSSYLIPDGPKAPVKISAEMTAAEVAQD